MNIDISQLKMLDDDREIVKRSLPGNPREPISLAAHELPSSGWKIEERLADSDPSVIAVLRNVVTDTAREAGASPDEICDIQIAVGEALTNAYRHGSPVKGESKITLRCMVCAKALVVEIKDEGAPFCPDSIEEPDPNDMRDHGMGIYLMRQAMNVVHFCCDCPGNRVRMVKWLNGG